MSWLYWENDDDDDEVPAKNFLNKIFIKKMIDRRDDDKKALKPL